MNDLIKKIFIKYKNVILVSIMLVVSMILFLYYKRETNKKLLENKIKYDKEKMTKLQNVKTFFVGLYHHDGNDIMTTLYTLSNIYHTSSYPLRINVGIIFYNTDVPDIKYVLNNINRPYYSSNINILAVNENFKGINFARYQIENELYHGEDYIVFLSTGIQLIDGWDMIIQEKMNINHVWTSIPIETSFTKNICWYPVFKNDNSGLLTFDNDSVVRIMPSIRLSFDRWEGGIPVYNEFENMNCIDKVFDIRSITKDFFVIHKSKKNIIYPINEYGQGLLHNSLLLNENCILYEFLITHLLLYNDIPIKTPGYCMAYSIVSTDKNTDSVNINKSWTMISHIVGKTSIDNNFSQQIKIKNKFEEIINKVTGINFYENKVSLNSYVGINESNEIDEEEIISKYGSFKNLSSIIKHYKDNYS